MESAMTSDEIREHHKKTMCGIAVISGEPWRKEREDAQCNHALYLLSEIAAQLAAFNERLARFAKGDDVLNVETGLDKGEPLPITVMKGGSL
jgi:hypothetical protein